jgi:hypothetical protein
MLGGIMVFLGTLFSWFGALLDGTDHRTSERNLMMIISSGILCYVALKIGLSYARMVWNGGHANPSDVGLLSAVIVPLAALAGAVYTIRNGEIQIGEKEEEKCKSRE